ncbi:MFS transporter [Noviherbaspirillum malthae]|uniref:MFS transporter n=1 Tax=Noviherbaspirillum malthae TaxID=1260987 RepID=UPI00188F8B01|nr:MFS transporter [Noviherbaspirillum malthae]
MKSSVRFSPLALVLAGGAIMGLSLGVRHAQGLFVIPLTSAHGWTRGDFAFAIALQNLIWGLAQPFTGMIADRFGSVKVVASGCLLYGAGLYFMSQSSGPAEFVLSAGLLIGIALSCRSFSVIYGALSRLLPLEKRAWGLGLAGAAGGLGQFVAVPFAQNAIDGAGAEATLVLLAISVTILALLAFPLRDKTSDGSPAIESGSLGAVLRAASFHKGFWMLGIGFLACGFQLAFIATHLPAYLLDKGLNGRSAMIALSLIAMANVAGTYVFGLLGARLSKPHLLAGIYLVRSAAIAAFVLAPISEASLYVFAVTMGFLWLGTVPLTNGIVSQIFGVKYLGTLFGFVFLGHQIGSFLGVWLGGIVFDLTRSYDAVWICSVALGLIASALHWPIQDRPVIIAAMPRPA